jgi:hypothetical protein
MFGKFSLLKKVYFPVFYQDYLSHSQEQYKNGDQDWRIAEMDASIQKIVESTKSEISSLFFMSNKYSSVKWEI